MNKTADAARASPSAAIATNTTIRRGSTEVQRLRGDGRRAADQHRRVGTIGPTIRAQHDVRVEYRDECVEITLAGGGEERVVAPVGHTGTVHLAQLNVGRLRAPIDDPRTGEFVANLEPINVLAEASPGYVWRLKDASGDATHIRAFEDELMIVNLTVWTSIEALADFVFRTGHVEFLRRRREWFESAGEPTTCLWWIPEGKFPSVSDAIERLDHLRAHGPTPASFTFRTRFDPGGEAAQPGAERDACPA